MEVAGPVLVTSGSGWARVCALNRLYVRSQERVCASVPKHAEACLRALCPLPRQSGLAGRAGHGTPDACVPVLVPLCDLV